MPEIFRIAALVMLLVLLPGSIVAENPENATDKRAQSGGSAEASPDTVRIAIIIDDVGYNMVLGRRAALLPAPVTLAVLPHTPNGASLANLAHQNGKEVMLHAPMTSMHSANLEPGGLSSEMALQGFTSTLINSLDSIPHVAGVNNHQGSFLTQLKTPMQWLMQELARRDLYFIDSRTSPHTIAHDIAVRENVRSWRRDIFLDNQLDDKYIEGQFRQLLQVARLRGYALAIGHPHLETIVFLEKVLPELTTSGIELVFVSELLELHAHRGDPRSSALTAYSN